FNMDRFWKSFGNILWHFPALTIVVVIALMLVAVTWWRTRRLPPQVQPLLLWSSAFALSTVVGAIGWGTEFAHYNAYMPAFLHGALAAGAAIPAILACGKILTTGRQRADLEALGLAVVAALPLALACWTARWQPQQFIPTAADVAAGNRLIERIKSIDG